MLKLYWNFPHNFPHIWHFRKTDIYNCKEKSVEISLHFSSHFTTPHFPHNFPYIYFSSHFPYIFPHIWHVRKTDIYNCKEKSVEISLHFSSHFPTPHFPHNFPYIYLSSHFPYIFPHIWHVRKPDIYNSANVRKMSGKCVENVRKL